MLVRTEEFRARLALAWHHDVARARLRALPQELRRLWDDERLSLAERRAKIFSRWDDCDDAMTVAVGGPASVEGLAAARTDAATRARRAIERFVREHAPRGSAVAYGDDELRSLNATRRSQEAFAPYRTEGP